MTEPAPVSLRPTTQGQGQASVVWPIVTAGQYPWAPSPACPARSAQLGWVARSPGRVPSHSPQQTGQVAWGFLNQHCFLISPTNLIFITQER